MEHENKVISFDFFELKAKDIRYCEMCEVSMVGIINHLYEAAKQRETKLCYFKEFYSRLKKSGCINTDFPQFEQVIDEIYPMPPTPDYDNPLHYLYVVTAQNNVYEFWDGETGFDIYEKLGEIKEAMK